MFIDKILIKIFSKKSINKKNLKEFKFRKILKRREPPFKKYVPKKKLLFRKKTVIQTQNLHSNSITEGITEWKEKKRRKGKEK